VTDDWIKSTDEDFGSSQEEIQTLLEKVQTLNAERTKVMELAHEIRQPLTAAIAYLSAMRKMLNVPPEERQFSIKETLDKAAEQIEWTAKIVQQLCHFVPSVDAAKTLHRLHDLVQEAVELVNLSAKNVQVQLNLRLDANKDLVLADPVQIKQVVINLIRNSIEAMKPCKNRNLTISSALIERSMIQIGFADTGVGISKEVADKIFDMNVTTKSDGSGVGLALSRRIISAHGGTIWAANNNDSGATVSFTLPLAEAK
jgi:two-component system sensor kinase FixL